MLNSLINEEFQRIILNNTIMWLNILDNEANVIMWNKAAEEISGYAKEEVLGNNKIWKLLYPEEEYRTFIYNKSLDIINNGEVITDFETTIISKDGTKKILSWNTHNMKDNNKNIIGSLAIARDITKLKANEKKLQLLTSELEESNKKLLELSYVDQLTNIPNRRAYDERFAHELQAIKRSGNGFSFLIIDIDKFKEYNDIYGHINGDIVLYRVSNQIKNILPRKTDFLARYGGEELVAILPYTPLKEAQIVAKKILQSILDLKIEHSGSIFNQLLTVSIGVTSTETCIENVIGNADQALYKAKNNGRNRFEVYSPHNSSSS
jgi:diguanylate cyclase (GGDEF)-like protein/PAS domain S-box-containing protein